MKIRIKYSDGVEEIKQAHPGEWYDLRAAETIFLRKGSYYPIPLGVAMELPEGYEAHVLPRSSTFDKYNIIMVNGMGVIDNKYHGNLDVWSFPAYAVENTLIMKNERIAQFRIVKQQEAIKFEKVDDLGNENRNGLGSTGRY